MARHELPEAKVLIGWQYKLPERLLANLNVVNLQRGLPLQEAWWVATIFETKEDTQNGAYGGFEGRPLNEVRPLYAEVREA